MGQFVGEWVGLCVGLWVGVAVLIIIIIFGGPFLLRPRAAASKSTSRPTTKVANKMKMRNSFILKVTAMDVLGAVERRAELEDE